MRFLSLTLILLIFQIQVEAEDVGIPKASCGEFQEWASFFDEFEDEYLNGLRHGSRTFDHIRNNLFSDKYFKSIFGIAVDELSASRRNVIQIQFKKCYGKKNYQAALKRLDFFILNALTQQQQYQTIIAGVREIREQRKKYNEALKQLNDKGQSLSLDEVYRLRSSINFDFGKLLVSEREFMMKKVDGYQLNLDRSLFISEARQLSNAPATLATLQKITQLENKNDGYLLLDDMPPALREAQQQLAQKKGSIGESLMAHVRSQFSPDMDRVKYQTTARDFMENYGQFMKEAPIRETYETLLAHGVQIMKKNESDFYARTNAAVSVEELSKIQGVYLNFLSEDTKAPYLATLEQKRNALVEQQNVAALRAEKMRDEKLKANGIVVRNEAILNRYPNAGKMIKAVADGEFKKLENNVMLYFFFKQYVRYMGKRCPSALPENKIRIAIYNQTDNTTEDARYWTGLSQMPIYTTYKTETVTSIDSIYIDPRLQNKNIMTEDQFVSLVLAEALQSLTNSGKDPFNTLQSMREISSFVKEEDCSTGIMAQIGENFYRYMELKPSIQAEILSLQ